jgi:hypothetical protein
MYGSTFCEFWSLEFVQGGKFVQDENGNPNASQDFKLFFPNLTPKGLRPMLSKKHPKTVISSSRSPNEKEIIFVHFQL